MRRIGVRQDITVLAVTGVRIIAAEADFTITQLLSTAIF